MPRRPSVPALLLALVALGAAAPGAARAQATAPADPPAATTPPSRTATVPRARTLYHEGQDGRYLLDGPWLYRADPTDTGVAARLFAQTTVDGWSGATVPGVWNVGGTTRASFDGAVGWYRKDFRLPASRPTDRWVVRFEAVNFRATVWLNGRRIGEHVGGHTPFELELPNVARGRVNRLVVRVDNRRTLPVGSVRQPIPPTGWWNYGGIPREVYLRRIDRVDLTDVYVQPQLPRVGGPAVVTVSATVRNATDATQVVDVAGRFGDQPLAFARQAVPPRASRVVRARLVVRRPRLWSPARPQLYDVRLAAAAATAADAARGRRPTAAAGYRLRTGIRQLAVARSGQLTLNGQLVRFRGVALHEDSLASGAALDDATRRRLIALVRDAGATLLRAHYPLHPRFQELADRHGILIWSEIPSTYQLPEADLGLAAFRRLALQELREDLLANRNRPSVAVWSVGNEMASQVGANQAAYLRESAALVKQLHPTGLVGLAFAGHPETDCQPAYDVLDVLGMNDYFGWYTGYGGNIADRDNLEPYLDQLRRCYPRHAIAITEFGAEANREGPEEEKGTYAFQTQFVADHLAVYARKPWLSGAVYWALQEFRIRNGWGGGNPWGQPPLHQKGLVRLDWTRKPAWATLRASYRATRQYVPQRGGGRATRPRT